jgi:putative copper export protein
VSAIVEFAHWLQSTQFSIAIQSTLWIMPLVQAIHIVMIGIVFVSLLVICLRVLGRVRMDESLDTVWKRFAPWTWTALAVMAATGLVMMCGEPVREATATSFWLKMGLILIVVAMVNGMRRSLAGHAGPQFPSGARFMAIAVIVVLVAIVFLGRAIAYDVEVWGSWT